MPNSTTVMQSSKLPSAGLGNATAETQFTATDTTVLTVYMPMSSKFFNKPFGVTVQGRITTGASSAFTGKLYWGNSSTIGNNTQIASTGAVTVATTSCNFLIQATLSWDSTSQKIQGTFSGQINNTAIGVTAISNVVTAVDLTTADVVTVGLSFTGLFGTGNASNTAFIDVFEIDAE